MVDFINPLDLESIFVYVLAGSPQIFLFIALLFIAGLAGRFRMPNSIFLLSICLFGIFLASSSIITELYFMVIILSGTIISYLLGRLIKS